MSARKNDRRGAGLWTALVLACATVLATQSSCGGAQLRARSSAVDEVIVAARDNGAQRCAPVELATAEASHAFAEQELAEGNYFQARRALETAEVNAQSALEKSPKAVCNPTQVAARPKPSPKDTDGDGLNDDVDECPKVPEDMDGWQDEDGCPELDNDNDGINDVIDKCPNDPEDKDGFEDEDGCPDNDNDKDGLADKIDQCPDVPEDKDGFEDDDGCPDCDNDGDGVLECPEAIDKCPNDANNTPDGCPQKYKLVVVTEKKIELKQTVYFDYNKSTIRRVSFALLNEVAAALKDNPTIKVRIEGHTDSRGNDAYNLKLSDARAASVRDYMIAQGIDESRMVSEGFGEKVPIADNRTQAGRDQNRRVEFVITSR